MIQPIGSTFTIGLVAMFLAGASCDADVFHVSKSGSNGNSGSAASPFLTIQDAADAMLPGDRCVIHAGTYREEVTPARDQVSFEAAAGEVVVVSAFEEVSGWSLHAGSIHVADLGWDDLGDQNQVFHGGEMMNLARWPNKTNFDPFDLEAVKAWGDSTTITHAGIPLLGWSGGGVVWYLGKSRWTSWRRPISGSGAGSVSFADITGLDWQYDQHSPANGGELILMNVLGALDSDGEWYIDRSLNKLYFQKPGGGVPVDGEVLARRRTRVFNLNNRTGVTVDGLRMEGGSVEMKGADSCVVKNCRVYYGNHTIAGASAAFVGDASILLSDSSTDNLITRCDIRWGAGNGIVLKGVGNRIDNNHIANFNYLGSYACPIELRGTNMVTRNEISHGGRDLIRGGGAGCDVGYNDLHHSNRINDDCGPIYFCCNTFGFTRLHHNWIHDCTSRDEHFVSHKATGIYLDNTSEEVIVDHNVIWDVEWACIQINWAGKDLLIYNNTLWSNTGPESSSMGRWVNGFEFNNVPVFNTLSNEGEYHYTSLSNTCTLPMGSDPFTDLANRNFVPVAGTCPENGGMEIPGFTDGFVGGAPEVGAYEIGGFRWVAGPDWAVGDVTTDEMYLPSLIAGPGGSADINLNIGELIPFTEYVAERSMNLVDWEEIERFEAPIEGGHLVVDSSLPVGSEWGFYRVGLQEIPFIPPVTQYSTSFDGPAFTAGNLNSQDDWIGQTQWQADGAGNIFNTSGAFVRAQNTIVRGSTQVGEVMSISTTFSLSAYQTPSGDIAGFEEGILQLGMSHQETSAAPSYGLAVGLFYEASSGDLVLRQNQGINETGTSKTSLGAASGLGSSQWRLEAVFTKTAANTWTVDASIDNLGDADAAFTVSYSANGEGGSDLDTDSDGGGIGGGFQALPSGGGSNGVATPPFTGTILSDYSMSITSAP